MGPIGAQEMIFIFILALLLFGPKKLPELGRMLGKGLTEFRRAKNELKTTFESHMQELEREARISEKTDVKAGSVTSSPSYSSATYPYPYDEFGAQSPAAETGATAGNPSAAGSGEPKPEIAASDNSGTSAAKELPSVAGTVPRTKSMLGETTLTEVSAAENRSA